jgi:hypothetical protein
MQNVDKKDLEVNIEYFFSGEKAVKEIQKTVKEADLELMMLDLDSLDSVREFAAKLHNTVDKVHNCQMKYISRV